MENIYLGITTLSTFVIAVFTIIQFIINKKLQTVQERLSWFTGAMESHSALMLRLEAEKQNKEIIWWDPTKKEVPFNHKHGDDATVKTVRMFVPEKYR